MTNWHDDDAFWTLMAPFMFDEARWASTAAEIDLITELAQMAPGTAVLDLGCGPGRHSLELARRGHRVTGVDRTRPYLQQAREKADQEGLAVEFMEADMRAFRRPERFDVALNLFTAFGYFEDAAENERVLYAGLLDLLTEIPPQNFDYGRKLCIILLCMQKPELCARSMGAWEGVNLLNWR